MKHGKWLQWGMLIIGIMILTFGARIILLSELGVGGIDAIAIGLAAWLDKSIGTMMIFLGVLLVIIGSIVNKKLSIVPIGISILTGTMYDLWGTVWFNHLKINTGASVSGYLFLIGILIAPFGAGLYILSKLATGPVDYMMLALQKKYNISMQNSRIFLETSFVIIGWLIGGPIGIGTICIMLFWGPILQVYYKLLEKKIGKYIG